VTGEDAIGYWELTPKPSKGGTRSGQEDSSDAPRYSPSFSAEFSVTWFTPIYTATTKSVWVKKLHRSAKRMSRAICGECLRDKVTWRRTRSAFLYTLRRNCWRESRGNAVDDNLELYGLCRMDLASPGSRTGERFALPIAASQQRVPVSESATSSTTAHPLRRLFDTVTPCCLPLETHHRFTTFRVRAASFSQRVRRTSANESRQLRVPMSRPARTPCACSVTASRSFTAHIVSAFLK